ncbi:alpha/beta hydrolase [Parvibaculum sp.]|uniref:alpha/beta fold hydrolase n=1 Tax=Parvibaculum sp. TaxID=2024848 RepID=UPI001D314FD0|nr:alpha/beta hydrolase [Parvibaculum sp.]MBX3490217.1 alpha/beta hydrolase [Parvibaculum sp.]MCW5729102.1 alpha/beta hydrolase [Parvibaculum sp.]
MINGMEEARFGVAHLDRISLHYAEMGPADGPLVILLHGFPDTCLGWSHQMPALAKAGFRVVAPDQRGYGLSGKPRGVRAYDLDELADDIVAFGAHFGETRLRVVGHDWGASVAWWLASTRGAHLEKAAAINAPHPAVWKRSMYGDKAQRKKSRYVKAMRLRWLPEMAIRRKNFEPFVETLKAAARAGVFDGEVEAYKKAWREPKALTSMLHWYRALLKKEMPEAPGRIETPLLLIWGEKDQFAETALARESIALCERGGTLFFAEGSHWVHREEVQPINEMLITFLQSDQDA